MALLKPNDVAPEGDESRQEIIAEALTSIAPKIPGVQAVRHITPLVMSALHRANNPYVTAKRGFDAMGIEFDGDKMKLDPAAFGISMMPKTAEVLVLLSCDRDTLKKYAVDAAALESAALDFMEDSTPEILAEATVFVSQQLMTISKTRSTKAPEDQEAPESAALKGGGRPGPKKPARTGSHKS